jgi:hypothetical protein
MLVSCVRDDADVMYHLRDMATTVPCNFLPMLTCQFGPRRGPFGLALP